MSNDAPVAVGQTLDGKFRIDGIIGKGAMGVVVRATHLTLDRPVAIKFLSFAARGEAEARFKREAWIAARLKSQHAAKVIDVGMYKDSPFIVMEYLEGEDLAELLKRTGPLGVGAAVTYALQACEALAEAHAIGVVHRDVKPANMMLTVGAGGLPCVKLLDFGVSKLTAGAAAAGMEVQQLTATSQTMGSPLYMAPEQINDSASVDGRADVWSMGIMLYQLLTDTTPWTGSTILALFSRMASEPPTPIASYRPDVPPGLAAIIDRCIQRDRARRWPTMVALAEALAPYAPFAGGAARPFSSTLSPASGLPVSSAPMSSGARSITPMPTSSAAVSSASRSMTPMPVSGGPVSGAPISGVGFSGVPSSSPPLAGAAFAVPMGNPAGVPQTPPVSMGNPAGVPQTPPVSMGNRAGVPQTPSVSMGNPAGVPQTPPVSMGNPAGVPQTPSGVSNAVLPSGHHVPSIERAALPSGGIVGAETAATTSGVTSSPGRAQAPGRAGAVVGVSLILTAALGGAVFAGMRLATPSARSSAAASATAEVRPQPAPSADTPAPVVAPHAEAPATAASSVTAPETAPTATPSATASATASTTAGRFRAPPPMVRPAMPAAPTYPAARATDLYGGRK